MSDMTRQVPDFALLFDSCPEPSAVVEKDAIVAANRAFRDRFGDATSWTSCVEIADHNKLPTELSASCKFVARPAIGPNVGVRMQWTAWPLGKQFVCVRLDGLAGPEIPPALEPLFAAPLSLEAMIAGKVAEQLDATTWSIAKDGTILVSEGRGLVHWGVKPGQIVGLNAFQIYPDGTSVRDDLETTLVRGELVHDEQVDTNRRWIRACHPVRDRNGAITAMVGFSWSGTQSTLEMTQAQVLLGAIAEMPVTIWAMEPDGTCTLSVGKGLRHFGLKSGELVGKNLLQIYPPTSDSHKNILRALQGETVAQEVRIGEMAWFSTIMPLHDALGQKIIRVYGIAENITERSVAQQRIEEQLVLIKSQQDAIQSQQDAITALSSPIIEVWQGILVVPLIGALDGHRATRLTENLLEAVVSRQSRAVILDLTGTPMADPSTAQHLFDIMRSVRLLGAKGLVSGIRPNVAKAMVELDIAGTQWKSFPTLAEALRRLIGKRLHVA